MEHMITGFANTASADIYHGRDTKAARKLLPTEVWSVARRKMDQLHAVSRLEALRIPPNNRLEKLGHDRKGQWAIRINDQYRLCFRWADADVHDVEITDYH
jgi:proteic killer suppression protein